MKVFRYPNFLSVCVAALLTTSPLFADASWSALGFLDVTTVTVDLGGGQTAVVDPTGVLDSTVAIQAAVEQAHDQALALYFPHGTYLISDTIVGAVEPRSLTSRLPCNGHDPARLVVIVGTALPGERATIRLMDGAEGFGDPNNPKPMFRLLMPNPEHPSGEQQNCIFASGIRNFDLDVGEGNTGAIGIRFSSAQECFIENIKIELRDGFAGITGSPGRSMLTRNVEVIGGQYGVYSISGDAQMSKYGSSLSGYFVHMVFRNQSQAAFVQDISRGTVMTGFHIVKDHGPAIITSGGASDPQIGNVALYDGRVEFTEGGTVIDNTIDALVAARNIHVKGATSFVTGGIIEDLNPADWTLINRFVDLGARTGADATNNTHLVEGIRSTSPLYETVFPVPPPANLLQRHYWFGAPDFRDPEAVNVQDFGAVPNNSTDDLAAFQAAIAASDKVFVPKGTYNFSAPLVLQSDTILYGVPVRYSNFAKTSTWNPTEEVWLIDTVDDPNATTVITDVAVATPTSANNYLSALRWRVGRHSVKGHFRDILGSASRREDVARSVYKLEGSGGGRWFYWTDHFNASPSGSTNNPNFRKLLVHGTTEPFTMYGINPEHGGSPEDTINHHFVELRSAENVRFLGMKSEANGPVILVKGSSNIHMAMMFINPFNREGPGFTIDGTQHIAIDGALWPRGTGLLIEELNYPGTPETVGKTEMLGLYSRGGVDWGAWDYTPWSSGPTDWAGFSVNGLGYAATDFLGDLFVIQAPWLYQPLLGWMYLEEEDVGTEGAWIFLPRPASAQGE